MTERQFASRVERDEFFVRTRQTHSHVVRGTETIDNHLTWWVRYGELKPKKLTDIIAQAIMGESPLPDTITIKAKDANNSALVVRDLGEEKSLEERREDGILETQETQAVPREAQAEDTQAC